VGLEWLLVAAIVPAVVSAFVALLSRADKEQKMEHSQAREDRTLQIDRLPASSEVLQLQLWRGGAVRVSTDDEGRLSSTEQRPPPDST
jgi:hypothetical protein